MGDIESTPMRTESQVVSQKQINCVLQHLEEHRPLVEKLKGHLESLTCNGRVDSDVAGKVLLRDVGERLKANRNLGEDLLEDMLALDKLVGLHPEDRSNRKAAIANIEALLEIVDGNRAQIVRLQKEAQSRLDALTTTVAQQQSSGENSSVGASGQSGHIREQEQHVHDLSTRPAMNMENLWKEVRLPIDFRSRERRDAYILFAQIPNLDSRRLRVAADAKRSNLTVTGLSLPNQAQAAQLRRAVASQLSKFTHSDSPLEYDTQVLDLYSRLGQGHFGAFSQNFRLPVDADVEGIKFYLENGVLRVVIPRTQHQFRRSFGDVGFRW